MNTFLCSSEKSLCGRTIDRLKIDKTTNLRGIAVKLSRLKQLDLDLDAIVGHSHGLSILVDAEYHRLDVVLSDWLQGLREKEFSRLLLTVQMKRRDSIDQMKRLEDLGIAAVLSRGNSAYLNDVAVVRNAYETFAFALSRFDNVAMVAGTPELAARIGIEDYIIGRPDFLLELQGMQTLVGSSLWIYFNNGFFSKEARDYLSRRKGRASLESFICTTEGYLNRLLKNHFGYVFLDACCKSRYLELLGSLTR